LSHENSALEAGELQNRAALEGLFALEMGRFYKVAARLLQNPQDSEDALQDAMLSAFLHLDQFNGRSRLSTWMHSIVSNAALSQLRRRKRLPVTSIVEDIGCDDGNDDDMRSHHEVLIDSSPNPEERCASEERTRMLRERLNCLPRHYRSVVQMCIFEGFLQKDVAQKLGLPIGTVKARLHRACTRLAKGM
jgi:RNA polymerase sigma-70 factor, ECF subfamily